MSENFDALTAAVNKIGELINETLAIVKNEQVDNNAQTVVDALTIRLNAMSDALSAIQPASNEATSTAYSPETPVEVAPAAEVAAEPAATEETPAADTTDAAA